MVPSVIMNVHYFIKNYITNAKCLWLMKIRYILHLMIVNKKKEGH